MFYPSLASANLPITILNDARKHGAAFTIAAPLSDLGTRVAS